MTLIIRIQDEKTSWRWRLWFTTVNVFFHARNHTSFMREMLVFRIINREDDYFDRFEIHVEFFVSFFLKFIENDHLSWMKNAVNRKWWMRKWVVKKTKMRHKWVLNLKEDFFFFVFDQTSLSLRFQILLSFLSNFSVCSKISFCCFCDVVYLRFSFDCSQDDQVWSFFVEISQDRARQKFEIEVLSKMHQVFDRELVFHVRFQRKSCRVQSLQTSQCRVHDNENVVDLSTKCRWLITVDWFYVLCRLATNSRANLDCRHFCSKRWTSCCVNAQNVVSSKIDEAARTRTLERKKRSFRRSTSIRSNREFFENFWKYRSLSRKYFDLFLSTTLIFLDRRLWAIDRARYRWECVRCSRSFA